MITFVSGERLITEQLGTIAAQQAEIARKRQQYEVGDMLRREEPYAHVFRVIGVLPRSIRIVLSDLDGTLCLSGPTKIGKVAARKYYKKLSREDLDALRTVRP